MGSVSREHLQAVARFIARQGMGFTIRELAQFLGTSRQTAARRLKAYATSLGQRLDSKPLRRTRTGPASATFSLRPREAETGPERSRPVESKAPRPEPAPPTPPTRPPLPLAAALLALLTPEEHRALQLLFHVNTARTSELARELARSPARIEGVMRALIRKLHKAGSPLYDDEPLPNGETLYRLLPGAKR